MKKFGKLAIAGLLAGGLVIPFAGCVNPDPFVPPEGSGDDKVIINDAYDWNEDESASTRPELGGGYVPAPPLKEAEITIAEGSPIKFAGGKSVFALAAGKTLKQEDFDDSTLNGFEVGGVAVLDAAGRITETFTLDTFMPKEAMRILPFYSLGKGADGLFGSESIGDYINDADFNDISGKVSLEENASVLNGWLSNKINVEGTLAAGSSFRALTLNTVEDAHDYTYSYRFTNHGQSAVSFTVYQMREGFRWSNGHIAVAGEEITLEPGASSDIISLKLENTETGENAITVIKVNGETANLSLGVAMAMADSTAIGPATITLKLPDGVTVADDYVTETETLEKLVLPTEEQVTDGSEIEGGILGWFDTATGRIVNENTTVLRSMTIAPYWQKVNGYERINIGSGQSNGMNPDKLHGDIQRHIDEDTGSYTYRGNKYNETDKGVVVNGGNGYSVIGSTIRDTLPVSAGASLRFDSKRALNTNGNYEFFYTVENRGTSKLHLSIYQINASTDYKSNKWYGYESERYRVNIELEPGESTTATGQYNLASNGGGNMMTYIVLEEDVDSLYFGIAASYKKVDAYDNENYPVGNLLNKNVTIAYDKTANGGIEVKDGYLTKRVGRFITAPTANDIVIPEDIILVGWELVIRGKVYDLPENRVDYLDLQVPSCGATLRAKFSKVTTTPLNISLAPTENFAIKQSFLDKVQYVGSYLVLPTEDDIENNTGLPFRGWRDKTTGEVISGNVFITSDTLVLEPVLAAKLEISAKPDMEDFEISQDYLDKSQFEGDKFVLPSEGEYTNTTGLPVVGWKDALTGNMLTADTVIDFTKVVLEPVLAEAVTVTVQTPEGLTIGGTFKTQQAETGKLTLPSESDITANTTGMGNPAGWYNVADKAIVTADTVLTGDITIAPYWNTTGGYTQVQLGGGANYGYNNDMLPGDFAKHVSNGRQGITYYGYNSGGASSKEGDPQIITGADYDLIGSVISDSGAVQAGSAIRFDSKRTLNTTGNYEYVYTVQNKGKTDLWLSFYQINASSEYKSSTYYGYESRYRTEVKVAAGDTVTVRGQYNLASNSGGNMMTYIVFEKDVASFSMGISISYKAISEIEEEFKNQSAIENNIKLAYNPADNGGIEVADSYLTQRAGRFAVAPKAGDLTIPSGVGVTKWQIVIGGTAYDLPENTTSYQNAQIPSSGATLKAVLAVPVTITWLNNNGVSVDGGKTSCITQDKLENLPAVSATTTDGRTHLGWYDTATGNVVNAETVVESAMTIAPYFAPKNTALTPASGVQGTDMALDSFTNLTRENFSKTQDIVAGDEIGTLFTYNGSVATGSAFRFKTFYYSDGNKQAAAGTYKFHFSFTNYGDSELKFNVYQVAGGTNKVEDGKANKEVTLAVNATVSVTLELQITANKNALTYFEMLSNTAGMNLAVSMSIEGLAA